jgi:hypothetical protein
MDVNPKKDPEKMTISHNGKPIDLVIERLKTHGRVLCYLEVKDTNERN